MPIPAILASVAGAVVSGLVSKVAGSSAETQPATKTLGKDDFLRLLIAQLRNQDPLNPVPNNEFVAQTAQFSSLEQLQNMNKTLEGLAAQSGSGGAASASALLGKTVTVNGSALTVDGVRKGPIGYSLPTGAASVAIRVVNESGNVVRTLIRGQQGSGVHQLPFDGLDDQGRTLPSGLYTYQVVAADAGGRTLPGVYTGGGQVTGVAVEAGGLMLVINNSQRVPLSSVVAVTAGTTAAS